MAAVVSTEIFFLLMKINSGQTLTFGFVFFVAENPILYPVSGNAEFSKFIPRCFFIQTCFCLMPASTARESSVCIALLAIFNFIRARRPHCHMDSMKSRSDTTFVGQIPCFSLLFVHLCVFHRLFLLTSIFAIQNKQTQLLLSH